MTVFVYFDHVRNEIVQINLQTNAQSLPLVVDKNNPTTQEKREQLDALMKERTGGEGKGKATGAPSKGKKGSSSKGGSGGGPAGSKKAQEKGVMVGG